LEVTVAVAEVAVAEVAVAVPGVAVAVAASAGRQALMSHRRISKT
jgi:hypothetical protein